MISTESSNETISVSSHDLIRKMTFTKKTNLSIDGIPKENNRLLTLCFCSLAVTCTEVKTAETTTLNEEFNIDDSTLIRGSEIEDEDGLDYIHIPRIPCNIARIFWSELLDVNSFHSAELDLLDGEDKMFDRCFKVPKKQTFWNKFITEDERKTYLEVIESETSPTTLALEKIKKELSENDIEADEFYHSSFHTYSLSQFFRNELTTICAPPSFDNKLLLKDVYFQYLRDMLLKSNVVELVVLEKDIVEFIDNQESYERLSNMSYFLDDYSIASLKQFFNPKTALEYFKPIIYFGGNDCDSSMASSDVVVKLTTPGGRRGFTKTTNYSSTRSAGSFYNTNRRIRASRRSIGPSLSSVTSNHCCVQLMQVSKLEGGFAVIRKKTRKKYFTMDSGQHTSESFSTTFEIWNHVMAEACLKLYNPYYSSSGSLRSSLASLDTREFDSEQDRKDQLEQRASNMDDTLSYALKLLPSHLMRARRIHEAIELLKSYDFLFSRCCILGAEKTARQLRQDCEELRLRLANFLLENSITNLDENNYLDPKKVILNLFDAYDDFLSQKLSKLIFENKSNQGKIYYGLGWTIERMGFKLESLKFYKKSLKCKKEDKDYSRTSVISALSSMSTVLLSTGQYGEGIKALNEKLILQKEVIGDRDIAISKTLKSIGMVNGILGDNQASMLAYEEAITLEKSLLGENDPQLQDTFNSLGRVYIVVQNYAKAVECYEESLRIAKLNLDENNYRVARAHHNLGRALFKTEDYNGAITHLSHALTWRNRHLPENHEDIAKTLHAMGSVYVLMDYDPRHISNAVSCFEDALQITRNNLGPEHEEVGRRLYDLAVAYGKDGKFDKAVETKEEIVRILRIKNGDKHESVADAVKNLGLLCRDQGDHQKAIDCFLEVLEIYKYHDEGDCESQNAISEFKTYIERPSTSTTANMLHDIGNSYYNLKSLNFALEYYKKAYRLRLQHLGKHHVDVAESQYCIGVTHSQQDNDEKALKYLELALKNRKSLFGMKNAKVADTLYNLARIHKNCFEYALAISRLIKAHKIRQIIHGMNHVKVADTKYFIAVMLSDMGKFTDGLLFFNDALLIYKNIGYSLTHIAITNINRWITFLEDKLHEKEVINDTKMVAKAEKKNLKDPRKVKEDQKGGKDLKGKPSKNDPRVSGKAGKGHLNKSDLKSATLKGETKSYKTKTDTKTAKSKLDSKANASKGAFYTDSVADYMTESMGNMFGSMLTGSSKTDVPIPSLLTAGLKADVKESSKVANKGNSGKKAVKADPKGSIPRNNSKGNLPNVKGAPSGKSSKSVPNNGQVPQSLKRNIKSGSSNLK